jgi:endoglycosylceramidase
MGYDLFNEPSAGTQTPTCAQPAGCPAFDATMQKLYDHVRAGIRTVDQHNLVWYEQQFFANAISAGNFTRVDDPEVGLSWHDYACTPAFVPGGVVPGNPDCVINEPRVMDNATAQAASMGAASVLSEYGAEDDIEDLTRMTAYADQHLAGWMYWAYKLWDDPTGSQYEGLYGDDSKPSTLKTAKVDVLVHPYPQAIAGLPTSLAWDPAAKVMSLSLTPDRRTGYTDVFVPARTYANGYTAVVTGGQIRSAAQARHLIIDAVPGASSVRVVVEPAVGGASVRDDATAPVADPPPPTRSPTGRLAATGLAGSLAVAGIALLALPLLVRRRLIRAE